ncbi:hypothetical protein BDAP_002676 [Binucleata daphniae]
MERQLIVKKINVLIEDILEDLYEIFDKLQITNKSDCEEMQDMVNIKRRYNKVMDSILIIYSYIVKLKYIELQKRKINSETTQNDTMQDFENLLKSLK